MLGDRFMRRAMSSLLRCLQKVRYYGTQQASISIAIQDSFHYFR